MNTAIQTETPGASSTRIAERVKGLDWERVSHELDAQGSARLERLLSPDACQMVAGLYPQEALFRSRIETGSSSRICATAGKSIKVFPKSREARDWVGACRHQHADRGKSGISLHARYIVPVKPELHDVVALDPGDGI